MSIDVINDCDDYTYYAVTISYLLAIVVAAVYIDDLTLVFGFIAAFSESMFNFVFPGLFFLSGYNYLTRTLSSNSEASRQLEQ